MILGGPPKKGKSRLVLDTMLRAAQGFPAFGIFEQDIKKALYYNAEGGVFAIKMRAGMYRHLDQPVLQRIAVSSERPTLMTRDGVISPETMDDLAIAWAGYDVVVLDPLVSFHEGDENSNQQMGNLFDQLRILTETYDVSLVIVHHTGKTGKDETAVHAKHDAGMRLRGASAIHGAVDSAVMAWPTTDGLSLVFDLRYAENPGEIHLAVDHITGRFYLKTQWAQNVWLPDPHDFAREYGYNVERYMQGFGIADVLAQAVMKKASNDATSLIR